MSDQTGFQRKRRELREQTSVAARMNEEGSHDPYAKADENYDAAGVKDTGTRHQEGDPPPTSEDGHVPEQLPEAQPDGDAGATHQEGNPPPTSVELREDEEPETIESPDDDLAPEFESFADQRQYDATDGRRPYPDADRSLGNVELADPVEDEERVDNRAEGANPAGTSETDYASDRTASKGDTVPELRDEAKERGITGYSSMNKAELKSALGRT